MPIARFSQPSICQHSHLKSFQQWYTADTGRCNCSVAAVDKDVGQACSGVEQHITVWCFLSLTEESLLWQTMPGKSWDEAHISVTEGSSLEQDVYMMQLFFCVHVLQFIWSEDIALPGAVAVFTVPHRRFLSWKLIALFDFSTCDPPWNNCQIFLTFFLWRHVLPGIHLEVVSAHPCLSFITLDFKKPWRVCVKWFPRWLRNAEFSHSF